LIARVTIAAAALVALGLLCASCGGGDNSDDIAAGPGTSAPATTSETPRTTATTPDTGGVSAPRDTTSRRGATGKESRETERGDRPISPSASDERAKAGKPKTGKRVRRDVYKAGRQTCFIFGIEQIRHEYELVQRSPEDVARYYANLFEKANPELIAPYYQGCLRGLRERAQRDRQVEER
jgi:hypothetical protein